MTETALAPKVDFTRMEDGSAQDYELLESYEKDFVAGLADRVLAHLRLLDQSCGGHKVSRLEHSLQSASRAHRDGRDEEYVVCALLHDIGDLLACYNHSELAATILEPFVSEKNHWMVKHHGVFQGYYYFHHKGGNRDAREKYRGHEHFDYTAEFCELYDQCSFDPDYESMSLDEFEPMVRRVFKTPKRTLYTWNIDG